MSGNQIKNFLSLVKFSHTLFALPFALIGFFVAIKIGGFEFKWLLLVEVLLCMVFARNAAMAFNRYIDREIDKKNPRTVQREIPGGIITAKSALLFVIINCLLFILTTYFINKICFYLSPVALIVVLGYSLTKRFTALCHLVLGLGLSLAPIGAYLAVAGEFNRLPLYFSFAVLTWVGGFDIIYALQDEEFDKEMNLSSIPSKLGKSNSLLVSEMLHILTASLLMAAGMYGKMGTWFWMGYLVFITMLIYQHRLVKPDDLSRVNLAFFTTNGIASVLFGLFTIIDLYL